MKRPLRIRLGLGLAAGLACVACCLVELSLVGGLSAVTVGAEFAEFARFTPLLAVTVPVGGAVAVVLRRRRRRAGQDHASVVVALPIPQRRPDDSQ